MSFSEKPLKGESMTITPSADVRLCNWSKMMAFRLSEEKAIGEDLAFMSQNSSLSSPSDITTGTPTVVEKAPEAVDYRG